MKEKDCKETNIFDVPSLKILNKILKSPDTNFFVLFNIFGKQKIF